ncbi:MAG: stage II sporulation protein M [Monoglobales bacterium]
MIKTHTEKSGKLLPYVFLLTFIAGITVGGTLVRFAPGTNVFEASDAPKSLIFANSFKSFLKPCLIIWVFGFTRYSVYFSSGMLAYRGGILGFAIGCIIKNFGLSAAILSTLPQNLIFFPFLLFVSLVAAGQRKNSTYLTVLLIIFFACAFSALIDTFITAHLIRLKL